MAIKFSKQVIDGEGKSQAQLRNVRACWRPLSPRCYRQTKNNVLPSVSSRALGARAVYAFSVSSRPEDTASCAASMNPMSAERRRPRTWFALAATLYQTGGCSR